jgi:hypothetical protein
MAAGKSTVTQLLAEQCQRSATFAPDAFRRMIVSGRAEMRPDQAAESLAQLRLRYRLGAMVADGYASAGFTAVAQDVISGPEPAAFVDCVGTRPRYVVVLIAPAAALAERDRRQSESGKPNGRPRTWTHAFETTHRGSVSGWTTPSSRRRRPWQRSWSAWTRPRCPDRVRGRSRRRVCTGLGRSASRCGGKFRTSDCWTRRACRQAPGDTA